jgi:hypothetical protein
MEKNGVRVWVSVPSTGGVGAKFEIVDIKGRVKLKGSGRFGWAHVPNSYLGLHPAEIRRALAGISNFPQADFWAETDWFARHSNLKVNALLKK